MGRASSIEHVQSTLLAGVLRSEDIASVNPKHHQAHLQVFPPPPPPHPRTAARATNH